MSDKSPGHLSHPVARFFLLDVFFNQRARPALVYALFSVTAAAVFYRWLEGWSWTDSFYFVVITFATIGYGYLVPTQAAYQDHHNLCFPKRCDGITDVD